LQGVRRWVFASWDEVWVSRLGLWKRIARVLAIATERLDRTWWVFGKGYTLVLKNKRV
jgi:hypothetical protein